MLTTAADWSNLQFQSTRSNGMSNPREPNTIDETDETSLREPATREPNTREPNTREPNTSTFSPREPNTREPNTREPNTKD